MSIEVNLGNYAPYYRQIAVSSNSESGSSSEKTSSVTSKTSTSTKTATSSSSGTAATDATTSTLDKDDFLELLIAQLTNQDPMDPLSDTDFIAQMAQFSTLEQITNLNTNVEDLASVSKGTAVSYIGRTITYTTETTDESGTSTTTEAEAVVTSVRFGDDGIFLEYNGGEVALGNVLSVE